MTASVEANERQRTELRIPGIGGPSPESVLGCPPESSFVQWRSEPRARSTVRRGPDAPNTFVYDWRPLTSGSRSFALWPLLLPFTLGNVVGFMAPPGGARRVALHRAATVLLDLVLTASTVVWLLVAALSVWGRELSSRALPGWVPGDTADWAFGLAAVSVAIATAALVGAATHVAGGFERFRRPAWTEPASWRGAWGASVGRRLDDPRFYDNGLDHKVRWYVHTVLAAGTWVAVVVAVVGFGDVERPWATLDGAVAVMAVATAVPVTVLTGCALGGRRRAGWRFVGPAAAVLAVTLLGGAVLSAVVAFAGIEAVPPGPPGMLFDVFGLSLLAGLFAAVAVTTLTLLTPSAAERHERSSRFVPTLAARLRSRLAVVPSRLGVAAVAYAAAFAVGTVVAFATRWLPEDTRDSWRLTPTAPVDVARLTVVFLAGFMFLNAVKKLGNPVALRRVGNVWDVLTFWPRTFHPFSVRPYAERAVPELQDFLLPATGRPGSGELVVLAHSQGSVLAYATLLPSWAAAASEAAAVRLVTAGSPLRSLYAAAFPLYVSEDDLAAVVTPIAGRPALDWTNVFRFTDHVGRAVFADDDAVAGVAIEEPGPGVDLPVPDPRPGHGVQGHNDYWPEPGVRRAVGRTRVRMEEEVVG